MKKALWKIPVGAFLTAASIWSFSAFAYAEDAEEITQTIVAEDLEDNYTEEELLIGYFESCITLDAANSSILTATGAEKLNAPELEIYNNAKSFSAAIASGNAVSTVLTVDSLEWSYDEMGMSSFSSSTLGNTISGSVGKIYRYLLRDFPYEFYWHDKTQGISLTYSYLYDDSSKIVTIKDLKISFAPANEYKGAEEFTVDPEKTKAASAAAETALAIVEKHKSKSDYEKLAAYKEEICALVSYDHDAADSSPSSIGIDPWQLIHVFDNDETTNVVCEGYSKAFQYLCDMSDFSGAVECYSVTGTMSGGAHMWNVVKIGKKSYLADITNCDEGTIGSPDQLFLKGMSGSVSAGYTKTIGGSAIVYKYDADDKSDFGTTLLTLSGADYSEGASDADESDYVIWANGAKDYKAVVIEPEIEATTWVNTKGKTQKAKYGWTSLLNNTGPVFESEKHKIITKSDKTVVAVSNGKVTAKSGGLYGEETAYIFASDIGTMKSEMYSVTVKNAPSTLFLFDDAEKTAEDKKEKLKSVTVTAGGASERVYIVPFAKQGEVSADCTYSISAKKNDGNVQLGEIKSDEDGNMYFDISGLKIAKAGAATKISVTVICQESGKKASLSVMVVGSIESMTLSGEGKVSAKGDAVDLKVAYAIAGDGYTSDKAQIVVSESQPSVDSTGKKVTIAKSKQVVAKLSKDGSTLTLKAGSDVTVAQGVYAVITDAVSKEKRVVKLADIAADGTIAVAKTE